MPLFVSSKAAVNRHGVFAIQATPPALVRAAGTGCCGLVGEFAWGPDQELYEQTDPKTTLNTFAPAGMSRTTTGYLSLIRKQWPQLRIVRALVPTAVKASVTLASSAPANIIVVTAKYKGTEGNSITATVAAASDADSNHFNLTLSVTGATGTTTETLQNLNYSGTGADSAPVLTDYILFGTITKSASGRPVNGTFSLTSGTNGTITAAEYVGTAGAPDKGFSLFEADSAIRHVTYGDCGNSIRAAVNAGAVAHVNLMRDRCAYIYGNSGMTAAATRTDSANYRSSENVVYAGPWGRVYDDTTGAKQLVPPGPFAAAVKAQLSPSTSFAWKATEVQAMMSGLIELESDFGAAAGTNTEAGVCTIIREEEGGFTFESAVLTCAPSDPAKKNHTRTSMAIYIAAAVTRSLRPSVDAPNVPANQQDIMVAIDTFLAGLKRAQSNDPNHNPHILDYSLSALSDVNSDAELDAGDFTVEANVKISSGMERIFFQVNLGENVTISVAA